MNQRHSDIAIIGMAGRFPDAPDINTFYNNLKNGKASIRPISFDRVKKTTLDNTQTFQTRGFMENVDMFDHRLFNLSMSEAQCMDPHIRLLFEVTLDAIYNSGHAQEDYQNNTTSVYATNPLLEYYKLAKEFNPLLYTGNSSEFLAPWISRFFNLKGSAMSINTSCSSFLAAIQSACNDIKLGNTDTAFVCAVNLELFPYKPAYLADVESPDGRSVPFSSSANGMVFGETAGCIILKSLEEAIGDRDHIHAVIKSVALNNNGRRSTSIAAPDNIAQSEIITKAWRLAGIKPSDIGFVEAHGSGTELGDSLEVAGLSSAFRTERNYVCPISTVKTNIGHCRTAAGFPGIVKAVLSLQHKQLFPTPGFKAPNRLVDFKNSPVYVNTELLPWKSETTRYAGVSGMGIGGSNCHVVLEEYNTPPAGSKNITQAYIFPFSANTLSSLNACISAFAQTVDLDNIDLEDIAFTLSRGRSHYKHRASLVARSTDEIRSKLLTIKTAGALQDIKKTVFVFSDLDVHSARRVTEDLCRDISVFNVIFGKCRSLCEIWSEATETFSYQYAFCKCLEEYGISTKDVLGTGAGKLVALTLSGKLSLHQALQQASIYIAAPDDNLEEKVTKMIERETASGPVAFVAFGNSEILELLTSLEGNKSVINVVQNDLPFHDLIAQLYVLNFPVSWDRFDFGNARRVELPGYAFDRVRCWIREDVKTMDGGQRHAISLPPLKEGPQASAMEKRLAAYWCEALNLEQVSRSDNFFDVGGDSIKATQVINRINRDLPVRLDFEDVFDFPVLADFSRYIHSSFSLKENVALYFKDALNLTSIDASDSFFDLGGQSIIASQVINQLSHDLGLRINFDILFKYPSVNMLSEYLECISAITNTNEISRIQDIGKRPDYALSHGQKRIWVHHQLDEGTIEYNEVSAFALKGVVDQHAINAALSLLVQRHDVLRTTIRLIDGQPRQVVADWVPGSNLLEVVHIEQDGDDIFNKAIKAEACKAFNLSSGPLLRSVLMISPRKTVLTIVVHHIVIDGWSFNIIIREFVENYDREVNGNGVIKPPLKIQYKDYVAWQQNRLASAEFTKHREFWKKLYEERPPELTLPFGRWLSSTRSAVGGKIRLQIPQETAGRMFKKCRDSDSTLFIFLLTSLQVLLNRYSRESHITVGTPVAARNDRDIEEQVGFYANILPITTAICTTNTLDQTLLQVLKQMIEIWNHQEVPFDVILEDIDAGKDVNYSPLFNVVLALQKFRPVELTITGMQAEQFVTDFSICKYDLALNVYEVEDSVTLELIYRTEKYSEEHAQRFLDDFLYIVDRFCGDGDMTVSAIDLMREDERHRLLHEFNDTASPFPSVKTIVDLFDEQVSRTPDNIAVVCNDITITYSHLSEHANRLASFIYQHYNISPDDTIAVIADKSERMIIALLAILKSGAGYVPIDPEHPSDKISHILRDSGCKLVIVGSDVPAEVDELGLAAFSLTDDWAKIAGYSKQPMASSVRPDNLAYIIYTSGTTGIPKGVMIEHRNVVNLMLSSKTPFEFGEKDVWTMFHVYNFDFSVWEIYGALLYGGKLVVVPKSVAVDTFEFYELVQREKVTVLCHTPPAFYNFIEVAKRGPAVGDHLRYVIFGGDELKPGLLSQWKDINPSVKLVNMYGITETTVHVTFKEINDDDIRNNSRCVGTPISNVTVLILDNDGNLCPPGISGEICVGGNGLGRGYVNSPELSSKKYVFNPVTHESLVYRSGDIGRWLSDGTIEFFGRRDEQIKIRGHRIEIKEIETAFLKMPALNDVQVLAKKDTLGYFYLVAFFTANGEVSETDLRNHLVSYIPDYMMPAHFVRLTAFPLTANGKTDRKALMNMKIDTSAGQSIVKPVTEMEEMIAVAWASILAIDDISVTANFFNLGGDSIKAIQVVNRLRKQGYAVKVRDIFSFQTIAALANVISQRTEDDLEKREIAIVTAEVEEISSTAMKEKSAGWEDAYPMSDIEIGMIYHQMMFPGDGVYHDQMFYQIEDSSFQSGVFEKALSLIVERNPILRTSFHLNGERSIQVVHSTPPIKGKIEFTELSHLTFEMQKEYVKAELLRDRTVPFQIETPCLWRMKVFKLDHHNIGIAWIFHHAILDGWSNASFMTLLANTYFALKKDPHYRLAPLAATYKDFVIDQLVWKRSAETRNYWKEYLNDVEKPGLPFGKSGRKENQSASVSRYATAVDTVLTRSLLSLATRMEVSVQSIFLSAFIYAIKATTNKDDVIIGLVTNNRPEIEDGDNVLGCFLNTIPFRFKASTGTSHSLIRGVSNLSNRLKQYEKLSLREISKTIGNTSDDGLFDVLFNFIDFHVFNNLDNRQIVKEPLVDHYENTNALLHLNVVRTNSSFVLEFLFKNFLFNEAEITRITAYIVNILWLFEKENEILHVHDILPDAERRTLLQEYNNTKAEHDASTLTDLFEAQVKRTPTRIALLYEDGAFTYGELNAKANQLARHLRETYIIKPDDRIAIMMDRSPFMIIAIYATLKAGAAYLPIDPAYPLERRKTILHDAEPVVVLVDEPADTGNVDHIIVSQVLKSAARGGGIRNVKSKTSESNLAYVIYTSGSTGKPKGVMIEHRGAVNRIEWMWKHLALKTDDVILQKTPNIFDVSVWELFMPLCYGASMAICRKEVIYDPAMLIDVIDRYKVSVIHFVPGMYNSFLNGVRGGDTDSLRHLRMVIASGEALLPATVHEHYTKLSVPLHNLYGPTEASVDVTCYTTHKDDQVIPIGKPISNISIYVLDDNLGLLPHGVIGELYIGGIGLARGYINNESGTTERFISNPYVQGERLYKTGDVGRWLGDGNIEYLGRNDDQVKIRGNRVEPGEIENVLLRHRHVEEVIVVPRKLGYNTVLVAYGKFADGWSEQELKNYLRQYMVEYQVPSHFVPVDKFKLTSSGKIDRKSLPNPLAAPVAINVLPRNETEAKLLEIWIDVLGRRDVGVLDNFFEAGGDSLTLITLVQRINEVFEGAAMQVSKAFRFPSVSAQAQYLLSIHDLKNDITDNGNSDLEVMQETLKILTEDGQ